MPSPAFFRNLGLFINTDFLDSSTCAQIRDEMRRAESKNAVIARSAEQDSVLDETSRKVLESYVEDSTVGLINERLSELKPRLETHFHLPLALCEGPYFLRYGEGGFYRPHQDTGPNAPLNIVKRRVSVVIFLNAEAAVSAPDCYGGGALTFHGLLDGPKWEKCAFALEAEPGLLVAFPSSALHEVRPVTFGQRFTIVGWFPTSA